jgi:hypothetical protein
LFGTRKPPIPPATVMPVATCTRCLRLNLVSIAAPRCALAVTGSRNYIFMPPVGLDGTSDAETWKTGVFPLRSGSSPNQGPSCNITRAEGLQGRWDPSLGRRFTSMRLCAGSPAQPSSLACRETGRSQCPANIRSKRNAAGASSSSTQSEKVKSVQHCSRTATRGKKRGPFGPCAGGLSDDDIRPGDERVQHLSPNLRVLAASPRRHMKRMIGPLEELQCRTLAK